MDPNSQQKVVKMLTDATRYNLSDPAQLDKAKKVLNVAKQLQADPRATGDQALNAALMNFFNTVGARPEVAGIRTTIQGNRWEAMNPQQPPLGMLKKR